MTDDQSHDTVTSQFMPNTKAMIADQGLTCTQFVMPTALCCPSRASFLTGKYARHDGVRGNEDRLIGPTFVDRLHASGYHTGIVGKYLNSWPGSARPEYDYWAAWISGYVDPKMNIFGRFLNVRGYVTYIERDYALDFLDKAPADKPFFLLFAPWAPHLPATPAPGDENLYSDLGDWRPPSFNPADQSDKPAWLAKLPRLSPEQVTHEVDTVRLNQLRCLHSVDIAVRDILAKLAEQGKLDNTFVVYYSDNGFLWGEHRLTRKNRVYEETSHGPFAIRYPPLIPDARTEERLVGVIDLAPTIYDLADIPMPPDVDGRSLVPLMRGTNEWRDAILLEGWPGSDGAGAGIPPEEPSPWKFSFVRQLAHLAHNAAHDLRLAKSPNAGGEDEETGKEPNTIPPFPATDQDYQAIRTNDFIYVETRDDKPELYDLRHDPYQMRNLVDQPAYSEILEDLKHRLHTDKL